MPYGYGTAGYRRPRRSRFVATGVAGRKAEEGMHVMAYSVEDAREVLRQHGITAESVVPLAAAIRKPDGGGYRLDESAIEEAKEFFGLTLPVRVQFNSRVGGTDGNWRLSSDYIGGPNFHKIMLKSYLTPEKASETLWHELTHAMQAEREARAAGVEPSHAEAKRVWRESAIRGKGTAYARKPIEIEARAHEQYAEALPLARPL